METRIGIVGYGNIGRGVLKAVLRNQELYGDISLAGIITRRPESVQNETPGIKVVGPDGNLDIDVAILCGGSATDLPKQGPIWVSKHNTVDSFDTHAKIPEYFATMDRLAKESGHVAVISAGWDPGTFSLERVLADAFLPGANPTGFYGLSEKGGLSMGHSDAIRRVGGVQDARQYTHAIPEAVERAKKGEKLKPGEMHWRECIVVAKEGADRDRIANEIRTMPNYFAPYRTTVQFVSQEELDAEHPGMPHDGIVIATALTDGNRGVIKYENIWGSNPQATANILVAHARAANRLSHEGRSGAFTILDIPAAYFSPRDKGELLKSFM
ncbi:MAG: diaminopimelate dehydrogenase [Candidatus Woesearchaeota archaeon]